MRGFTLSVTLAASLAAAPVLAEGSDDLRRVLYACEGDMTMEVVFLNTAGGNSYAFVLADGEMIPMRVAVSASGARYLSIEPQPTRQLWEAKGRADLVALDGEAQTPLRRDCAPAGQGTPR